jgi:molybdate transport system permease protein
MTEEGVADGPIPPIQLSMLDLSPDEWIAIRLSLRIALVATAVALPFGLAIAWLLARRNFWGKALLDGLIHLPLVLPPVVTAISS